MGVAPGTVLSEEAEQEGRGRGSREIWVPGIWLQKALGWRVPGLWKGQTDLLRGVGVLGWGHTGRRPGQSPEATLQGFPQAWPLFCIVWLFQVCPWGRERSGEQGHPSPPCTKN